MSGPSVRNKRAVEDRLPPHDLAAEQGVLGCILVSPESAAQGMKQALDHFGNDVPFYEPRHVVIFEAAKELFGQGKSIDLITVQSVLKSRDRLEQAGGLGYLAELPDLFPLAVQLPEYLEIVWEKYLAREKVRTNQLVTEQILAANGVDEQVLARAKRLEEEFEQKTRRGNITPRYLAEPSKFAEGFWAQFFGGAGGEAPGLVLPIAFPFKIRFRETTLVSGDDGSGKSTLLSYFALHLAAQLAPGEKVFLASMEVPGDVLLWILASQLLGSKYQADTPENRARVAEAMAWLNERFLIYDFTGIADWRDLLDTMEYAASHKGMRIGVIDSAMRIGIADDDYALQGLFAARLAQFGKDTETHNFIVLHENKGDGTGKAKVRGSKLWTANMDNVLSVKLNHKKGEDLTKAEWELEMAKRQESAGDVRAAEVRVNEVRRWWDTEMVLRKQRFPGTQQNGSKRFWFDRQNFQFRAHFEDPASNWLQKFRRKKTGE